MTTGIIKATTIHTISTLITTEMQATTLLRVIIAFMAYLSTTATENVRSSTTLTNTSLSTVPTTSYRCSEQPRSSSTTRTLLPQKPNSQATRVISKSPPLQRKFSPNNHNQPPHRRRKTTLSKRQNRTINPQLQHRPRSNYHQWLCTRMPSIEHCRLMLINCYDDCCDLCLELNKLQTDCCP